jgi:tripartite-type tricarboxylate transporter receptor subunit TctC
MKTIFSTTRRKLVFAVAAAACAWTCAATASDAYPSKPVRLLVGFSAGGAVDNVARQLGQSLGGKLGQPFVIENKPGATGTIAADLVAKSPADGYTLLLGTQSTMVVAPGMYPKLPFKPLEDFVPISLVASVPMALVVNPAVPVKNVKELIELARSKNGNLVYASSGQGGPQHVGSELLASMAGVRMVHVPYKGEANALSDLLGNQVPVMFGNLPTLLPHIRSGKVKVLAVSSLQRAEAAPDIPTVAESGLPGFEALTWFGLYAPAGTPRPVIDQIASAVKQSLSDPAVKNKLNAQGLTVVGSAPDQLRAYMKTETVKWGKLIETAHIKPE